MLKAFHSRILKQFTSINEVNGEHPVGNLRSCHSYVQKLYCYTIFKHRPFPQFFNLMHLISL